MWNGRMVHYGRRGDTVGQHIQTRSKCNSAWLLVAHSPFLVLSLVVCLLLSEEATCVARLLKLLTGLFSPAFLLPPTLFSEFSMFFCKLSEKWNKICWGVQILGNDIKNKQILRWERVKNNIVQLGPAQFKPTPSLPSPIQRNFLNGCRHCRM